MDTPVTLKRLSPLAILVLLLILLRSFRASPQPPATSTRSIEGRWKQVHAALGIDNLPDQVFVAASAPVKLRRELSKVDLRRRHAIAPARRTEGEAGIPAFFLARDAIEEPIGPLLDLVRRLGESGGAEKEAGRGMRRKPPSRATVKVQKDELGR
ncbi:hypothetical protein OF83DRAFT_25077 [Amylostereum chailletii]|nr:hypothetical protein OF83DRAFT_25077 [Amylostereum chailletii]